MAFIPSMIIFIHYMDPEPHKKEISDPSTDLDSFQIECRIQFQRHNKNVMNLQCDTGFMVMNSTLTHAVRQHCPISAGLKRFAISM
jgi:hypothetical protein